MKCYFSELIRPRQNALFKRRHIGDDIPILFDVITLTAVNKIPGSIFIPDIFKAFNSLFWDFMFRFVLKYCFGSIIVQ